MISEKYEKVFETAILITIFCFAVSLFNLTGYIFAGMILAMLVFFRFKFHLTSTDFLLFLFSVFYFLFYCLHFPIEINSFIWYFIGPWCAHILGRTYMQRSKNKNAFMTLIIVVSLGMFLHGILNMIAYAGSDYYLLYSYYRQSVDFWRGELVNVKTTEMLFTCATGVAAGALFTSYKTKYKVISSIILAISVLITIFLANRGLIFICLVIFSWRFCVWFADKRVASKRKAYIIIGAMILVILLLVLFLFNVFGFADAVLDLKLVQRFTSDDEYTRFDVWNLFFEDFRFVEFPFGGKLLTLDENWGYLHNTWLDCYNVVGVVPFIFLVAVSIKFLISFIRFGRVMKSVGKENELIVFQSLMLSVTLNMMIEPIIEANPYYFLTAIIFFGAMDGYMFKLMNNPMLSDSGNH